MAMSMGLGSVTGGVGGEVQRDVTMKCGVERVEMLGRLAESCRRNGLSDAEGMELLLQYNELYCDPPVSDKELLGIAARGFGISDGGPLDGGVEREALDQLDLSLFSCLPPARVEWLWPGRIPLGKVTVISGEPGTGKSVLAWDIAARVTRGRGWPDAVAKEGDGTGGTEGTDGTNEAVSEVAARGRPGRVLLVNADDDLVDIVRPFLVASGAAMESVEAIQGIRPVGSRGRTIRRAFDLGRDLSVLRAQMKAMVDLRLVVIDPVGAYCGAVKKYPTVRSRQVMAALGELAAECNVALVLITDPQHCGIPSRLSWLVERDPFESELRLWMPRQFHYGVAPAGLGFRVRGQRVEWDLGQTGVSAEQIRQVETLKRGCARQQCVADWLWRTLRLGRREATDVYAAGAALGLSDSQIWRARKKLGVRVSKAAELQGKWVWELEAGVGGV